MSGATDPALPDHAERMDAVYAVQRHIYDLTRKYYLLGRDRLIAGLDIPPGGSVLELGCGTARNLMLAARRYPTARLHGLDISAEMLKTARAKLAGTPLNPRIALARADATAFDPTALFGQRQFDRVFCSYTLSMIPDWQGAIRMGAGVLAPGGSLHIVDFGQQDRLPRAFRILLHAWLTRFHVSPRAALFAACEALAAEHGLRIDIRRLYRDYARAVVLTRPA
jgi:S-adenosylmethionine-diacylgycerolhomoserine-N-methlytransferase